MVSGIKKLRENAVPTLFAVPNPPSKINKSTRKSKFKRNPLVMKNITEHESLPSLTIDELYYSDVELLNISLDREADFIELSKRHSTLQRNYTTMKKNYDDLQEKIVNLKNEDATRKSILKDENSKLKQQLEVSTKFIS